LKRLILFHFSSAAEFIPGSGATALGSVRLVFAAAPYSYSPNSLAKTLSFQVFLVFRMFLALQSQANLLSGPMNSEEFRVEHIPLGYLITIRAYGTWLHGTAGSVDRFHNKYGTPRLPANEKRRQYNQRLLMDAIAYVLYDQGEPLPE
jgi:hypothetical protein